MAYGGHGDFGASQFAGAGFIQTQGNATESAYGSGGGTKKSNTEQTLRAVTIKQLLKDNINAHDGSYTVDGIDISTVALLGRIIKLDDKNSMQTQLTLDDGTCCVDVISFTEDSSAEDPNAAKQHGWHVGGYVRVVGSLRHFQQKMSVQAYSIRPVTDHNEITYHFLQCVFQHVHLTKGAPPPANAAAAYGVKAPASGGGGQMPAYGAAPAAAGPSSLRDALEAFFRAPENAGRMNGVDLDEAEAALRAQGVPGVTRQAVAAVCDDFVRDGQLYSTLNERMFRWC